MSLIFAQRLKEERLHCKLTQKQMAELLGIPLSSYRNYEALKKGHCEPDLDTVVRIARLLNTSTDYLLGKDSW